MGSGMSQVLPGLYVGSYQDAKDAEKLKENSVTHIVSVYDNANALFDDKVYLCIDASDTSDQNLMQFFQQCNEFIHAARVNGGCVLVHCLAGVSRSVTIAAAYLMTVTSFGWRDAVNAIRGVRNQANPNFGFQRQLQKYEAEYVQQHRRELMKKYAETSFNDEAHGRQLLHCFQQYVETGNPS